MNQEFILLLIFTETSVYCTTQYEIDQISKTLKCSFYLSVLMLLQFNHLVDYCWCEACTCCVPYTSTYIYPLFVYRMPCAV